jgi:Polyketide cyclase / dehydrase and lipid transport
VAHRRGLNGTGPGRTIDFTARAELPGRVRHVFDVLTDWPRQTAWVPATVVARPEGGPVGVVGERFVGTTTLGPWVLVDPMEVVARQEPDDDRPGRVSIVKTGDVFGGTVEIVVAPAGTPGGARVRVEWTEHLVVRPRVLALLAARGGPLPGLVGRAAFEAVLRRARDDLHGPS